MDGTKTGEEQPRRFPWWVLALIIGGIVVGGVIYQSGMK